MTFTDTGRVRVSLSSLDETDLDAPLCGGVHDAELGTVIGGAVLAPWAGRRINHLDFIQPLRTLSAIGG